MPLCGEEKWPIGRKNGDAYRRFLTSSRDRRKFAARCGRGPGAAAVGCGKGKERLALFYEESLSLNRSLSGGEKCTAIGPLYGEGDS